MSGSGGKVQEAVARANWKRYKEATLRQIELHRAFGWKALKYGIFVSVINFLFVVTIILEFSDAQSVPCRVGFAAILWSIVFLMYGYSSLKSFRGARRLRRELNEHIERARECEENGG